MPRVSVLTAVYNGEPYFDRAVPSILNQSYTDFEFIIVDDGSTDATPEFLSELEKRDARVRVLKNDHVGHAASLNYGLSQAQGEYIIRQDFDDVSYAERIARQVAFLEEHPEVGLVGTWYVLDDQNRGEKYIRQWPEDHQAIRKMMSKAIPFPFTQVAIRKEALQAAGGIVDVKNIIDLRTYINIGKIGWKFANIPEVLGVHYVYKESNFHKAMKYHKRQRELAWVQAQAVFQLGLAPWRLMYPAARILYSYMPDGLKRRVRRGMTGSNEEDIPNG